jgi:hypothetical protein
MVSVSSAAVQDILEKPRRSFKKNEAIILTIILMTVQSTAGK